MSSRTVLEVIFTIEENEAAFKDAIKIALQNATGVTMTGDAVDIISIIKPEGADISSDGTDVLFEVKFPGSPEDAEKVKQALKSV